MLSLFEHPLKTWLTLGFLTFHLMACLTILIVAISWQQIMLLSIVLFLFFSNAIPILISHCLMPDYLIKQYRVLIHGVMLYSNTQYGTYNTRSKGSNWKSTFRLDIQKNSLLYFLYIYTNIGGVREISIVF